MSGVVDSISDQGLVEVSTGNGVMRLKSTIANIRDS